MSNQHLAATRAQDSAGVAVVPDDNSEVHFGLTKREWFAGMALQAVDQQHFILCDEIAGRAVDIADAVIERLNQKSK